MNSIDVNQIQTIYNLLGDDISREIFVNRLMFSLTNDYRYIRDVACTVELVNDFYKSIKKIKEPIGIFGAGILGRKLVKTYSDIKFTCFIDNNKAGTIAENLSIISLKEFKENYPEGYIVISPRIYYQEIHEQILEAGYAEDRIFDLGKEHSKLNHIQYFDLPQLRERTCQNEIFIDCGCYDGGSSIDFINWCKKSNVGGCVYAWEPDPDNIKKCERKFKEKGIKYTMIPKGLWNETKTLSFSTSGTSESHISIDGDMQIEVAKLDDLIKSEVTFIKMDIEGSEYQALQGASSTIEKYKPKIAVSVYHKVEDIIKLPILIREINPNYKFYLRHYSFADAETVLYAL